MHLDKSEYAQAETIWIKSYLVAGPGHLPSPLSKNVYVELLSEQGELVKRLTLKSEEGLAKASLVIPRNQPQGYYYLRAHTNWMKNQPQGYFFNKKIKILSTSETDEPLKETITERVDLQFYPEGGELVKGLPTKMAFEVTGIDLTDRKIKGQIKDAQGKVVREFETQHEGRGVIPFVANEEPYKATLEGIDREFDIPTVRPFGQIMTVNNNRSDYLTVSIKSTTQSKEPFYLLAHTRGYVTYASETILTGSRGFIKIDKSTIPSGISHLTLFNKYMEPIAERLVFIDQGKELNVAVKTNKQQYDNRELATVGIKVTDAEGNPVQGSFSLSAFNSDLAKNDQSEYNIRTNLILSSDLRGHIRNPGQYFENSPEAQKNLDLLMMINGWRRFSWVDIVVSPQTLYPVETGLSLEGTLSKNIGGPAKKGKVLLVNANPNAPGNGSQYVFADEEGRFSFRNLDYSDTTFLRFQGFQKGGMKNVLISIDTATKESLPFRYPYNELSSLANPLRDSEYKKYAKTAIYIDSTYRRVNGITYLGTVTVEADKREERYRVLQSQYGKGEAFVNFDEIPFEHKAGRDPYRMMLARVAGFQLAGSSRPLTAGNPNAGQPLGGGPRIDAESIGDSYFRPPVLRAGPFQGSPLVFLDNVEVPWDLIYSLQATEIDYVEVYKSGSANMFGTRGFSGAIALYTLKGKKYFQQFPKRGLLYTQAGGYHAAREFYAPRYDTRRRQRYVPDRRATIFWEPMITTDENGEASLNFYTPDDTGYVTIDVQGLSLKGQAGTGNASFSIRSNF